MVIDEHDLMGRIAKVRNLREECFKYLEPSSSELLTHKVLYSIAKLVSEKMGPVKLGEIAQDIFGVNDKSKQDLIRLTVEKTLLRCGAVEKLHYSPNDVRYMLTAYRFQKVRKIESFRGDNAEPVGEVFELPRSTWPLSDDFLVLIAKRSGCREALKKVRSDYDLGKIQQGKYADLDHELSEKLQKIDAKIAESYARVAEVADGA